MSLYKINQFQYRILKWLKHELSFMIYETQIIRNVNNKKCFVIYDGEKPRFIYVNEPYPFQILKCVLLFKGIWKMFVAMNSYIQMICLGILKVKR